MQAKINFGTFTRYQINAGEYFKVIKIDKYDPQGKRYLIESHTTGAQVWTSNPPFKAYKHDPVKYIEVCIFDYVEAGWSAERIINTGLVSKEYRSLLETYVRHYHAIKNSKETVIY